MKGISFGSDVLAVILLAFVAVSSLFGGLAQNASAPPLLLEIRGIVLETGTNLPVVDAEISLYVQQPGPVRINGGWQEDDSRKARTDFSGAFRLSLEKAGTYRVEAKKPGYAVPERRPPDYPEVTLTAEKPVGEVKLFLVRPGQVTGTVVDADTGTPIADLRLSAVRKRNQFGYLPSTGETAKTDAEGRFAATGLQPGEYSVEIGPQTEADKRVLTKFSEQDVKTVEWDYEHTYWPGGHGQEAALPMTVASGATVDIGQIRVKKVPYYRVHARIPVSNCGDGDTMQVDESVLPSQTSVRIQNLARVSCGEDVLVTGFSPGGYRLMLSIDGRTSGSLGTASVPFSISDGNIEVMAPLTLGVTLEGAVVAAEGAKPPDFAKVKISLHAVDQVAFGDEAMPAVPGADGKFRIADVRLVGHRVRISGLGTANYVKEIRYNGIPLGGESVMLDQAALGHTLTIVVDDKPGTLTGTVVSGDKPISRPFIIVRKWPLADDILISELTGSRGDDAGKFQVGGLAPGEYRVIALRFVDQNVSGATVARALAAGKKIEIGRGGIQSVTLEPAD